MFRELLVKSQILRVGVSPCVKAARPVSRRVEGCKGTREGRMYIRKSQGPIAVRGPEGEILTKSDLPPRDTRRWVARRKAIVASAVAGGMLGHGEACEMYGLTSEELDSWLEAMRAHGPRALRVTSMQRYRQPKA
ncbi:MAG: DUF1153 domain-containing protein [Pseudomonadota bacterium]